jgi:hypothetical protein
LGVIDDGVVELKIDADDDGVVIVVLVLRVRSAALEFAFVRIVRFDWKIGFAGFAKSFLNLGEFRNDF